MNADTREPPGTFIEKIKFLGPGVVILGSIIGATELMVTTSLGAKVGFVLLWWIAFSCWSKSIIQANLARYAVSSGETALTALSRMPGKIPFRGRALPWFPFFWLLIEIFRLTGWGGIYLGTGQALSLAVPALSPAIWTLLVAISAVLFVASGSYRLLERTMLVMVVFFSFSTLLSALLLQTTPYAVTLDDLRAGFGFEFPAPAMALALAVFGGTGVNAVEISAYTHWCIAKGYARYTGPTEPNEGWVRRARGWLSVMNIDVTMVLVVITLVTIPFYLLGAAVLKRMSIEPTGTKTIAVLASTYTETFGAWAWWFYVAGAVVILYSTVISLLAGCSRMFVESMSLLGVIDPKNERTSKRVMLGYAIAAPGLAFISSSTSDNPIFLATIGASATGVLIPVIGAGTLYLRYRHLDKRLQPNKLNDAVLWICCVATTVLTIYTLVYTFA